MTNSDDDGPEPASLRFLRRLVTVLTGVMLAGLILIIGLIVTRFRDTAPPLPAEITLPDGDTARAVTLAEGMVLVVGEAGRLYIYDRVTGRLKQTVDLSD
ncbi:hypothetical protein ATO6_14775 [Oceanicola sp. 22II-s10i]|uniref:DUF6476 family protein n=1 Tax=Oceanicola sp. 22II-s10i TaxID=1317116 RepID=UPI000B522341|nr:DUF6476 family protein [Oceanicola sp. 22II-s10i]OWU84285.1 hypothetical protein ATO6_14775 [Oceanicola sp. 22II-s10i]